VTRQIHLLADASFDHHLGMAAIGVTFRDGRVVCGDTVRARDANDAEFMAVIRACQMLACRQASPGSRVYTDSHTVSRLVKGTGDRYGCTAELRKMLADHGWNLVEISRRDIGPAHTVAREVLQVWRAALGGLPPWNRTPYVKDEHPIEVAV
jgi:ribonuclease HI